MTPPLEQLIRTVRNKRVILDADLAVKNKIWPTHPIRPIQKKP
jgi:hypothetical protein